LIGDIGVYFDVKCFKDNVSEILKGIYEEVKNTLGQRSFNSNEDLSPVPPCPKLT